MKRINMVWVNGEYIPVSKAHKLYPNGFDDRITKSIYKETLLEKVGRILPEAIRWLAVAGCVVVIALMIKGGI